MKNLIIILLCLSLYSVSSTAKRLSIQERLGIIEQKMEQRAGSNTNSADIVIQNQQLQQQIAELKGIIEEQNHQIQSLKDKQKLLYVDIDSRLAELEAKPTRNTTNNRTTTDNTTPVTNRDNNSNTSTDTSEQSDIADYQNDYDFAFAHLRAGRFLESARAFKDFVQKYPDNELTDNAYYWLGESYYVKRQYPQALDAFKALTEKFPESKKYADSWLKIGYSYYEMDDIVAAEKNLKKVINSFPNSSIARLAKNRLQQMQRDH